MPVKMEQTEVMVLTDETELTVNMTKMLFLRELMEVTELLIELLVKMEWTETKVLGAIARLLGVRKTFTIATFLCGMLIMVVFKAFGFLDLLDEFPMSEKLIFGATSLYVCFTKTNFTGMEPHIFAALHPGQL